MLRTWNRLRRQGKIQPIGRFAFPLAAGLIGWTGGERPAMAAQEPALPAAAGAAQENLVEPIIEQYCYGCHGLGAKKGGVALDGIVELEAARNAPTVWLAVLKNVRSGIMPPADKPQLSTQEKGILEQWIKRDAFQIDPANPDPGHVTVRRLNRTEYRNTVRDLIGVEFDTAGEFPPDDTGHGFDNNGDVLTLSPLLLEKYLAAANTIISQTVPRTARVMAEKQVPGRRFQPPDDPNASKPDESKPKPVNPPLVSLSYYKPATISATEPVEHDGDYHLVLDLTANERFVDGQNDANRCLLIVRIDGEEQLKHEFSRQDNKLFRFEFDRAWKAGDHTVSLEVQPLTPDETQTRELALRVQSLSIRGPKADQFWVQPANYERHFPGPVPTDAAGQRAYARARLAAFAERAFRRPVDETTKDRLAALAESFYRQPGQPFEAGVAQGMVAILTSPRFLFREEEPEPGSAGPYPLVDEYSLASRLSYFLWSTMPDAELMGLAAKHELRANLPAQVSRMLDDKRSAEFFRHFVGQWLQARDIETVISNATAILAGDVTVDADYESRRERFRALIRKRPEELTEEEKAEMKAAREAFQAANQRAGTLELSGPLRRAMRRESEMLFEHVLRNDKPLVELLDSRYTFLNDRLARQYGIQGVTGEEMRLVELPVDSPRGGILTQGTVLAVTSNPDRTSPVKRGLYILDNILGSPPAPPPPNIPSLEEAGKKVEGRTPTVRESMELHRSEPSCSGCHSRMDPLGLALENYNALGRWRVNERGGAIDASGSLITGEPFQELGSLKKILVQNHRQEFYRCLTEKLLTYALGRGLDYHDAEVTDQIVTRINAGDGHAAALLSAIIESAPFQKSRRFTDPQAHNPPVHGSTRLADQAPRGADHER